MEKMSIVVPCYNEEKALPIFYNEIIKVSKEFENVEFEYIFVDDGSKDKTLDLVTDYRKNDARVRYLSF